MYIYTNLNNKLSVYANILHVYFIFLCFVDPVDPSLLSLLDRMVVVFNIMNLNPTHGEVYYIQT